MLSKFNRIVSFQSVGFDEQKRMAPIANDEKVPELPGAIIVRIFFVGHICGTR